MVKEIKSLLEINRIKLWYKRREWKSKREEILRRDNYECQKCKSKGRYSAAVVVHHIKHLDTRPDLALADDNLISLCGSCHNDVHPEKLPQCSGVGQKYLTPERW